MDDVSSTAYFCCGVRMDDAKSEKPIVNDQYAHRFMVGEGQRIYDKFKDEHYAKENILSRHKLIDRLVEQEIKNNKDVNIIVIGSGLDSRPFRMDGGVWVEIDDKNLIDYKNKVLPSEECKNPIERVGVDFEKDELEQVLSSLSNIGDSLVIFEGVLIYLNQVQINGTLSLLDKYLKNYRLISDVIHESFSKRYSQSFDKKVNALTSQYRSINDLKSLLTDKYGKGEVKSVFHETLKRSKKRVLSRFIRAFSPLLFNGYEVIRFSRVKENT